MSDIIHELARVLNDRRKASPETSYAASLFNGGLVSISEKLREELDELIEAADHLENRESASKDTSAIVHEAADLWFHSMVLLTHCQVSPTLILEELERRFGTSGHEEKRSRAAPTGK